MISINKVEQQWQQLFKYWLSCKSLTSGIQNFRCWQNNGHWLLNCKSFIFAPAMSPSIGMPYIQAYWTFFSFPIFCPSPTHPSLYSISAALLPAPYPAFSLLFAFTAPRWKVKREECYNVCVISSFCLSSSWWTVTCVQQHQAWAGRGRCCGCRPAPLDCGSTEEAFCQYHVSTVVVRIFMCV